MSLKLCRLTDRDQRKLLELFVAEVTARAAADLMGIQANTAALFYRKVRIIIAEHLETEKPEFDGEVELNKSYPRLYGDML